MPSLFVNFSQKPYIDTLPYFPLGIIETNKKGGKFK